MLILILYYCTKFFVEYSTSKFDSLLLLAIITKHKQEFNIKRLTWRDYQFRVVTMALGEPS